MTNFNLDEFKIPVISGINDIPIPPNFNGNGKGNNGAYYVDKHNKLVDLLSFLDTGGRDSIENFQINEQSKALDLYVGDNNSSLLEFTFNIVGLNSTSSVVVNLYSGINNSEDLFLVASNIQSGYTYNLITSSYEAETKIYWRVVLIIDGTTTINSEFVVTNLKRPIIAGSSTLNSLTSNTDLNFSSLTPTWEIDTIFQVPEFLENRYIYLFSPVKIKGIRISTSSIEVPTQENSNISISSGGSLLQGYYLYRSFFSTRGDFSFEIIF
jgi:hypothetical protein